MIIPTDDVASKIGGEENGNNHANFESKCIGWRIKSSSMSDKTKTNF